MLMSENAALGAASTFGNLFKAMGVGPAATVGMSEALVQLAADLSSFNNIPVDEVLTKLQSGIVGQEKPLRELGVAISAAAVDAKAADLGFTKVNGTFTEGQKVQARYALILEQTRTAQGDVARTGDQLINSQRKVAAEMEDTQVKVGQQLTPALTNLSNFIATSFIPTLSDTIDWLANRLAPVWDNLNSIVNRADAEIAGFITTAIDLNNVIGSIPGPWHAAADAMTGTSEAAGKAADDLVTVGAGMVGTADIAGKMADDVGVSLKNLQTDSGDWRKTWTTDTGKVIRDSNAVRTHLAADAQYLIDQYFDPLEVRADLFSAHQDLLAAEDAIRTGKTKVLKQQAAQEAIQHLDDEATALVKLGDQHALTAGDVKKYKTDVTAAYKAMGKAIPPEIQKIIDHLNTLAHFPDVNIGITVTPTTPLTKLALQLGYVGNQDLYKKFKDIFPPRAAGGPVSAGQMYVVGEDGPELFSPDQGGQIIPNGGGVSVGGGGMVINFNSIWPPTRQQAEAIAAEVERVQFYRQRTAAG
jgi:hypothetical protein